MTLTFVSGTSWFPPAPFPEKSILEACIPVLSSLMTKVSLGVLLRPLFTSPHDRAFSVSLRGSNISFFG